MNKVIGDISVESIVNTLFSNEEEGAPAEDDTVITLDPEVLEELTEEEEEIIVIPTEPEDVVEDESDVAEESARLGSEIVTMELAMRTAEEFMWKASFEAETVDPSILKKFWDWLKKIVSKIKEFLLTAFKRVQIWLAGDMKATVKWATDNKEDITKAISAKGDVTLKIKKPVKAVADLKISDSFSTIKKATDLISKNETDEAVMADLKKVSEQTTKAVTEEVYGKDAKSEDVKLSDFDKVVGIYSALTNATSIKASAQTLNEKVKAASEAIKAFDKASSGKEVDKSKIAGVKALASATQKAVSVASSVAYWKISAMISIVKISKAYAMKAMKANKAAA